ncbi:MAG: LAGLIDADG family homing endonuclease [Candidatus Berkelbacteria bacterium]|nr:LAGLIDADG family homing endonuclease [Candidatus Berkelbacteria bacterium]
MLNPFYIVGFVDGEGCFCISFSKHTGRKTEVRLFFEIELREDDVEILEEIKKVFDCGNIYRLNYERYSKWKPHVKYKVGNFSDIYSKIIPFFQKYPLQAKKRLQFEKFCKVAEMIKRREHLTSIGLKIIMEIKLKDSLDALDAHVQLRRKKSEGR